MDLNTEQVLQESLKIHLMYKDAKAAGTIDITKLTGEAKELYPYISEKIPSIVTIALGESYDYDRLKFMLNMHTKVKNTTLLYTGWLLTDFNLLCLFLQGNFDAPFI